MRWHKKTEKILRKTPYFFGFISINLIIDRLNLIDLVRQLAHIIAEPYSGQNNVHIVRSRLQNMSQVADRDDAFVNQSKHFIQNQQTALTGREDFLAKLRPFLIL